MGVRTEQGATMLDLLLTFMFIAGLMSLAGAAVRLVIR